MKMEARVPTEPGLDARMLMRAIIVDDQMKLHSGRSLGINLLQKSNELLMPMPWHAVSYDSSIKHAECGEQGGGSVSFVVMSHRPTAAFLQG